MNKHKYASSPPGLIALMVVAMLLGLVSQGARAAGTASGTSISNSASLAYSVGGFSQTGITSAAATFVVDNKVNLTVTKIADAPAIIPNSTNQVLVFSVTNNGNTAQSYALSAVAGAATATMSNVRIFNDNGATPGVYDGTNTAYVAGTATVAPDATIRVLIVADQTTPTATNTQTAIYSLLAQTTNAGTAIVTANDILVADTPSTVQVVWADTAGVPGVDVATDGKHSAFATYTVAITAPTIVKTATLLCDPFNGTSNPKNIPGSITQWSIAINNPSAVAVTLTTITDLLTVANLTIDPNLVVPTNAANCVSTATATSAVVGSGFKVVPSASRILGGSAAGAATVSYFTTTSSADGVEFITPNVIATFATILPVDVGTGHATAGLLNAGETVTLYFNISVN